jgi:di/tricarboxylate transporter
MKKELTVFDNPKNVKRFLYLFYMCLLLLLLIDPFIHKHAEFAWEAVPEFYAAYGFVSCVLLIFVAKVLRWWVKRDEDYYEH